MMQHLKYACPHCHLSVTASESANVRCICEHPGCPTGLGICQYMHIYIYVYVYPYVYIYAYMCMYVDRWWGMLVMNILVSCCGCDTGAEGVLALQNGMSWTSLLNNSGCINAKYVARHVHRCVSAEANEWYCQANSVAVGF